MKYQLDNGEINRALGYFLINEYNVKIDARKSIHFNWHLCNRNNRIEIDHVDIEIKESN